MLEGPPKSTWLLQPLWQHVLAEWKWHALSGTSLASHRSHRAPIMSAAQDTGMSTHANDYLWALRARMAQSDPLASQAALLPPCRSD